MRHAASTATIATISEMPKNKVAMPAGFVNKKPRDVDVRHNPVGRACPKQIEQPGRSGDEHGEGDRLEGEIGEGECSATRNENPPPLLQRVCGPAKAASKSNDV
jgi:hypothetical protein